MEVLGIPKEIKSGERRVALTPAGAGSLVSQGCRVLVEQDAGLASGFLDDDFARAGAVIRDASSLWKEATLIQKVKEPQPSEYPHLQRRHILFTFLHLASQAHCELVKALVRSQCTAIGYESVVKDGATPILTSMSAMAGTLAGYVAGLVRKFVRVENRKLVCQQNIQQELERLAKHFPEAPQGFCPGQTVVLGGGTVGFHAAVMCAQMGGQITITEIDEARRAYLTEEFQRAGLRIVIVCPDHDLSALLAQAEVIIGAAYIKNQRAPLLVTRELLAYASQQQSKCIIDVAVDQGGNVHGSRPTTYEDPLYVDEYGNIRFGVTNIPSICARQATQALEKVTLPYTLALAKGLESATRAFPELGQAINVREGQVLLPEVAQAHRL